MPSHPGGSGSEKQSWTERRRQKIRAEIERNRRGEYTVPTWVLALALVAMVVGLAILLIMA